MTIKFYMILGFISLIGMDILRSYIDVSVANIWGIFWLIVLLHGLKQKFSKSNDDGVSLKSMAHPEPNGLEDVFTCSKDSLENIKIKKDIKKCL